MTCVSEEFADLEVAVIFLTVFLHGWQALRLTLLGPTELAAGAVLLMDCQPGDSLITTLCFSLMESSDSQGQEVNWNRCYFRNCMMPRNHIFASLSLFSGVGLCDLSCFSHTGLLFIFWISKQWQSLQIQQDLLFISGILPSRDASNLSWSKM